MRYSHIDDKDMDKLCKAIIEERNAAKEQCTKNVGVIQQIETEKEDCCSEGRIRYRLKRLGKGIKDFFS